MKNAISGLLIGFCVGVVDVTVFKLVMDFPSNLIEAIGPITYWTIAGFLVKTSALQIQSIMKGIVIAVAMGIPWMVDYAINGKIDQIPMLAIIFVFYGGVTGFLCERKFFGEPVKKEVELM